MCFTSITKLTSLDSLCNYPTWILKAKEKRFFLNFSMQNLGERFSGIGLKEAASLGFNNKISFDRILLNLSIALKRGYTTEIRQKKEPFPPTSLLRTLLCTNCNRTKIIFL